ncbi:MAG TPA: NlpC/P60 family protein [Terriglobales bacterium]
MRSFVRITGRLLLPCALALVATPLSQAANGARHSALNQGMPDVRALIPILGAQIKVTQLDCSHLVNDLYDRVGLHYDYLPSRELYKGAKGFKRVRAPHPGDLIVWKGHVGVVSDPQQHTFVSSLRSGVKIANYQSSYWRGRGIARFFRFMGQPSGTRGNSTVASVRSATQEHSAD